MTTREAAQAVARRLRRAKRVVALTGAGISTESGIPAFRGSGGLWERYDPNTLEISYFRHFPERCWPVLKEIFFSVFQDVQPNRAHTGLSDLEKRGHLRVVITQNVDGLHQMAGSRHVIEYHGSARLLRCLGCGRAQEISTESIAAEVPRCRCGGLLKPDFVFFGEAIPPQAVRQAEREVRRAEMMLIIGTSGVVHPAADLPRQAKRNGAYIVEINPEPSSFTDSVTDLFIEESASVAMECLVSYVDAERL